MVNNSSVRFKKINSTDKALSTLQFYPWECKLSSACAPRCASGSSREKTTGLRLCRRFQSSWQCGGKYLKDVFEKLVKIQIFLLKSKNR